MVDYNLRRKVFDTVQGISLPMWYREDTSDYNTILSIFQSDEYRLAELGVNREGVYVDIGSHIGAWAVLVAKLGGEVYCYEPLPENLQMIIRNAQENGVEHRVHARWAAVGGEDSGYEQIYYATRETESGRHHRFIGTFAERATSMDTADARDCIYAPRVNLGCVLSDLGLWQIDIMKIDCEGGEWGLFGEAAIPQLQCIDRIIGEYHPTSSHLGGRAELLALCRGVYVDRTEEDAPGGGLGGFYFERESQWSQNESVTPYPQFS